jgi:hypothetical protein
MMNNAESFNGDNISFSAKELYAQAYQHNEKGERDKMYEISTILIRKYPESKEAKWAIRNFSPFWSSGEKRVINIQSYFTFGRGFLHAFGFFIPIYNIVRFIEITKGRTLRPLWIAILFSLVILNTFVLKSSVPSIYPVGFLSLLFLIFWLLYKQSTIQYAFGNIVGLLIMSALWTLISLASVRVF